jgi:aspartyl-tRNA(Asn)/glutamyl-tRNA(Gln) amidotransferase subunit A
MGDQRSSDNALWRLGVAETHSLYLSGEATPLDMLDAVLQRVEDVNPRINAFAFLDAPGAHAAATQSAQRWRTHAILGPLDGVVLTIKDNITVAGLPCSWGTEVFRDFVPNRDEVPVARLREAGAIILGKTTVSEFSNGRGIVSTRRFGTTRNPWRTTLTTGSSSAGSAASVACGFGAAALGTDGGGSIRLPASHCGLVGLKPSAGRVARAYGLPVILGGREVIGPLARSTADLALLLQVIAKRHPSDGASWGFPDAAVDIPIPQPPSQRVLYMKQVGLHAVASEVAAACDQVAATLVDLGHLVEVGEPPFDMAAQMRSSVITQGGMAWLLRGKEWKGRVDDYYARVAEAGANLTAADYIDAVEALREVQAQIGWAFERWDLILSPVTGGLPGPADQPAPADYSAYTSVANTAGVPAIAIPGAPSPDGLPIGFQLVGPFGAENLLLAMAAQYEQRCPWRDRWPPI